MMIALQQVHRSHCLLVSEFATGKHTCFWLGAKQKALALHYGHSQLWLKFDPAHAKVASDVMLLTRNPLSWHRRLVSLPAKLYIALAESLQSTMRWHML